MVEIIKTNDSILAEKMVITIEHSSIDDLQSMQNALISALVEFSRNKDFDYESESYFIAEILRGLQPDVEILETGFEKLNYQKFNLKND